MNVVGSSRRAWLPLLGVLLASAVTAGACSELDSTVPPEDGPPPASPDTTGTGMDSPSGSADTTVPDTAAPIESPGDATDASTSTAPTTTTLAYVEPSREWTLLAGGDVLMDRSEPSGVDPFEFIEPALDSADLAVVNSEMAISDRGEPLDKQYVFRAPPSAARRIASAGIDVVSLANNHAMDYGPAALVDTVDLLESAGVVALGAGPTRADAYRYRVLAVHDDVHVAFVGVSMIVPRGFPAGPDSAGIASARPPSRVLDSVRSASRISDVVVAVVHWGVERSTCPSDAQRAFARDLMDAGADAVIGHHPHVLQPVEFSGGRLVAYSLGNFVWHPRWGITGETGVLQIDFDADEIVGWTFHPHLLDDHGAPVPVAGGSRFDRIVDIIGGDCERHQPPPPSTTTTPTTSATSTGTTDGATSTTAADTTDTTTGG
ncbi:MAG: CapA family protein [bacterium]|nr:CapA family protein [bacterium]